MAARAVKKFAQCRLAFNTPARLLLPSEASSRTTPVTEELNRDGVPGGHAFSAKRVKEEKLGSIIHPERPVQVDLTFGYDHIKMGLTMRMQEVEISSKRAHYDPDKSTILEKVKHIAKHAEAAKVLNAIKGYEKVTGQMIGKWRKAASASNMAADAAAGGDAPAPGRRGQKRKHKGGRKPNIEFEQQVLDEVIFTSVQKVDDEVKAVVEANVAFTHAVIIIAAQKVQAKEEWQGNRGVQKLKFKRTWIKGLLKRHALRRKRITASEKVLPAPELVQARMKEIQDQIIKEKYTLEEVISADETGIFFGAAPKHQIVPADAARATAPECDDKARFTAMLFGNGAGEMGPIWAIIKMTVKGIDLSSSTVLKSLHKEPGFTQADGWELKAWERELTLKGKQKDTYVTGVHKRPYLINLATLEVITIQLKAWMDTPGICMWSEVQVKPWAARRTGRVMCVWDNCGPHKTDAVKRA